MRSYSLLKWFFLALLFPLDATRAAVAQQDLPRSHYVDPDVPASVTHLPTSRPELTLSSAPSPKAARRVPDPALKAPLPEGAYSAWKVSDITFGEERGPISVNMLRAPAKAQRELEKGLSAAKRQDWAKAKQHLKKSLEHYPAFSAAYHNLGTIALLQGDIAAGETQIERALELDERNLYALFALSQLRLLHDDQVVARRYIERLLLIAPSHPNGLAVLGAVQMRQGNFDQALLTFARLDRLEHRGLAEFHLHAGALYERKQELDRAVAEYKQYLRENPRADNKAEVAAAIVKLQTFMAAR